MNSNFYEEICAHMRMAPTRQLGPDEPLPSKFVFMPRGQHEIHASDMAGNAIERTVIVDEMGCNSLAASLRRRVDAGNPGWIDRNHDQGEACGWIHAVEWDPGLGIIAKVTWTPLGETTLRGGQLITFSPQFLHDRETDRVAGFMATGPLGALCNSPAFQRMPSVLSSHVGKEARQTIATAVAQHMIDNGHDPFDALLTATAISLNRSKIDVAQEVRASLDRM